LHGYVRCVPLGLLRPYKSPYRRALRPAPPSPQTHCFNVPTTASRARALGTGWFPRCTCLTFGSNFRFWSCVAHIHMLGTFCPETFGGRRSRVVLAHAPQPARWFSCGYAAHGSSTSIPQDTNAVIPKPHEHERDGTREHCLTPQSDPHAQGRLAFGGNGTAPLTTCPSTHSQHPPTPHP
jgi:hypothetical protein